MFSAPSTRKPVVPQWWTGSSEELAEGFQRLPGAPDEAPTMAGMSKMPAAPGTPKLSGIAQLTPYQDLDSKMSPKPIPGASMQDPDPGMTPRGPQSFAPVGLEPDPDYLSAISGVRSDLDKLRGLGGRLDENVRRRAEIEGTLADPTQGPKPGTGRKIAGILTGIAGGLFGGPQAGMGLYDLIANAPKREWAGKLQSEAARLDTESKGLQAQTGLTKDAMTTGNSLAGNLATNNRNIRTAQNAAETNDRLRTAAEGRAATADQKFVQSQADRGLDVDGNPLPREKWSPKFRAQQDKLQSDQELASAREDLIQAQIDYNVAKTEVELSKNDPSSPAYKLALQKLDMEAQKLSVARERNDVAHERNMIQRDNYDALNLGVYRGEVMSGLLQSPEGQPVPPRNAANMRPTSAQRTRADFAASAKGQVDAIEGLIAKSPHMFGPIAGRFQGFMSSIGLPTADASALNAAAKIAADHLAATFGNSSLPSIDALYSVVGNLRQSPEAALAALARVRESMTELAGRGQMPLLTEQERAAAKAHVEKLFGTGADSPVAAKPNSTAPSKPAKATPVPPPKAGDVVDGHKFLGGNPNDPKSWQAVK